jgi:hypothetical protein
MSEHLDFVEQIEVYIDGWLDYYKGAPGYVSDRTLHDFLVNVVDDKFRVGGSDVDAISDWLWDVVESGEVRSGSLRKYLSV